MMIRFHYLYSNPYYFFKKMCQFKRHSYNMRHYFKHYQTISFNCSILLKCNSKVFIYVLTSHQIEDIHTYIWYNIIVTLSKCKFQLSTEKHKKQKACDIPLTLIYLYIFDLDFRYNVHLCHTDILFFSLGQLIICIIYRIIM